MPPADGARTAAMVPAASAWRDRARSVHFAVDQHFDTKRATSACDALEIDTDRQEQARGRRRIDEQIRTLAASAQQLSHLRIFDPEKALGHHEFGAPNDRAGLRERARDRIGEGGQYLKPGADDLAVEAGAQRVR